MLELFNLFSDSKQAMKELNFNPTNICGGGTRKYLLQKIFKIGGQCSPSRYEGWCLAR